MMAMHKTPELQIIVTYSTIKSGQSNREPGIKRIYTKEKFQSLLNSVTLINYSRQVINSWLYLPTLLKRSTVLAWAAHAERCKLVVWYAYQPADHVSLKPKIQTI